MNVRFVVLATAVSMLASCKAEPQAPPPAAPLPAAVCAQVRAGLALLTRKAPVVFDTPDSISIETPLWFGLSPTSREQLAQFVALNAACAAKEAPDEQTGTVRSEEGVVLMRKTVTLSNVSSADALN